MFANVIFLPFGSKMTAIAAEQLEYHKLIVEGIVGIGSGMNPSLLIDQLGSHLSSDEREELDEAAEQLKKSVMSGGVMFEEEPEAHENHERYLLTYADMITLLMALFIILYAVGQTDIAKFKRFQTGLQKEFGAPALDGGTGVLDGSQLPADPDVSAALAYVSAGLTDPSTLANGRSRGRQRRRRWRRLPVAGHGGDRRLRGRGHPGAHRGRRCARSARSSCAPTSAASSSCSRPTA